MISKTGGVIEEEAIISRRLQKKVAQHNCWRLLIISIASK